MSKALLNRRSLLLSVFCGMVFAGALGLRLRDGLREEGINLIAVGPARPLVQLAEPHDYVLQPLVATGEEGLGPRRIISLAPSVTETLAALGLLQHLAGRTQFCTYPPAVFGIPVVGGLSDTNLEMISDLEADLVVTTANSFAVNAELTALSLRHASLPHESLEDVYAAIERAGRVCARPETARLLRTAIETDIQHLHTEALAIHSHPLRVLMVTGDLPIPPTALWVAGPGSFFDDLLKLSGHLNAAADILKSPMGEIPLERLLVVDPDVILTFPLTPRTPEHMTQTYRAWMKLGDLRAIRNQRVRSIGGAEWLSAGPRVALELHRFVTALSEFR